MYELVQAGPRSFYINSPAKVGVFRLDAARVCLIDSGSDKDAGKMICLVLEREGWDLHAVINTHSNAEHVGANRYLQQKTGCRIYAGHGDTSSMARPRPEPPFLFGGYPFEDLHHRFLVEAGCQVMSLDSMAGDEALKELTIIPLPGHFFQMTGVGTPDGTIYLADCLNSRATLDQYKIPSIYDVASYLKTLDKVTDMDALCFVPAHAQATDSIRELAGYNKQCVLEIAARLVELCRMPQTLESVLKAIFDHYGLTMTFQHHIRAGATVRSYLSWLHDTGQLRAFVSGERMFWCI